MTYHCSQCGKEVCIGYPEVILKGSEDDILCKDCALALYLTIWRSNNATPSKETLEEIEMIKLKETDHVI